VKKSPESTNGPGKGGGVGEIQKDVGIGCGEPPKADKKGFPKKKR